VSPAISEFNPFASAVALVALFGSLLSGPFVNTFSHSTHFYEPGDSAAPFESFVALSEEPGEEKHVILDYRRERLYIEGREAAKALAAEITCVGYHH
jgi:hypothetical protein